MILKKPYKDINETLQYMRVQIADGLQFARESCPQFDNVAELFYWLNPRLIYKHDPQGVELLQSLPTLLTSANYWGRAGMGDCDCYTIAFLTLYNTSNIGGEAWIKLASRNKRYPVHIWAGVDIDAEEIACDFTQRRYNNEREYPYIQKIYYKPL